METDGRLKTSDERALLVLREAADLASCLDALEVLLRQFFDVDGYAINLHQPTDNTLVCARVHMPSSLASIEEAYAHTALPVNSDNASSRVFVSGIPLGVTQSNVHEFPAVTRQTFESWNMKHMVMLPIQVTGTARRPIGTLMLFSQRGAIQPPTLRRVTRVVEEAAALLRLHQAVASWEMRASAIRDMENQLQSVLRFVAEMSNLTTDQDMYPRMQEEFLSRFDMDMTAVLLAQDQQIHCVSTLLKEGGSSWAEEWYRHCRNLSYSLDLTDGASSVAFVYNQHLFFGDIPPIRELAMSDKDRANLNILADLLSFAIIPIRKQGSPIGLLWMGSLRRRHAMTADQLVLAQHLCDFLGAAIENARAYTLMNEQRPPLSAPDIQTPASLDYVAQAAHTT